MSGIDRQDVVTYLRWLADQPDGLKHRDWLFHAAHIINRDAETFGLPRRREYPDTERHGDQTI